MAPSNTTKETQAAYAKRVQLYCFAVNGFGLLLVLGIVFFRVLPMVLLTIAFEFFVAAFFYQHRTVIIFIKGRRQTAPAIFFGLFFPAMALAGVAMSYQLQHVTDFILPAAITLTLMLLIFLRIMALQSPEIKAQSSRFLVILPLICYSAGAPVVINCMGDYAPPKIYYARVNAKYMTYYRSKSYRLHMVMPWDGGVKASVKVPQTFYDSVNEGEAIRVNLKPGLLHMPWIPYRQPNLN